MPSSAPGSTRSCGCPSCNGRAGDGGAPGFTAYFYLDPFGNGIVVTDGMPAPYTNRRHRWINWDGVETGNYGDAFSYGPTMFDALYAYECNVGPYNSSCLRRMDKKTLANLTALPGFDALYNNIRASQPALVGDTVYLIMGSELRSLPTTGGDTTPLTTLDLLLETKLEADARNVYVTDVRGLVAVPVAAPHMPLVVVPAVAGEGIDEFTQDETALYFRASQAGGAFEIRRVAKPK